MYRQEMNVLESRLASEGAGRASANEVHDAALSFRRRDCFDGRDGADTAVRKAKAHPMETRPWSGLGQQWLIGIRGKRVRFFVQLARSHGAVGDYDAVAEGRLLALFHCVVEGGLLGVEDAAT